MPMKIHSQLLPLFIAFFFSGSVAAIDAPKLDTSNFDLKTSACQDFYQHANGGWIKNNPIPAAYSSWGVFNEIEERNILVLKKILEEAAATSQPTGSNAQKLGDFYASAMDEAAIEKAGIEPIRADLKRIEKLKTAADIQQLIIEWHAQGIGTLFRFGVEADLKNSKQNLAYAGQGGLGLPERDYYTRDDKESAALRDKYAAHIARMLELGGSSAKQVRKDAAAVMKLETRLAKASLSRVELRDPAKNYNLVSIDAANKLTPNFNWKQLFAAIDREDVTQFSQSQPLFFAEMDKTLTDTPIKDWQAYLRWKLIKQAAPHLSKAFVDADFEFSGKTLNGTQELRPRWKRMIDQVNANIGEALGQEFVAEVFPSEAKAQALELVQNLQKALKARIEKLDWMSAETKQQALAKFATFTPKIGYPDQWRDYSALTIKRGNHLDNLRAGAAFEARRQFAEIDKPVDRNEWGMLPQQVNAYYNPLMNEIAFPAAILQPPFFDPDADAALNYGAIGAVIGHELMHGYDDKGSQFDAEGNLNSWWTAEDRKRFEERTDKLVAQFGEFAAIDDLHVNGKLTLGENIADLGGLLVAFDAFHMATANQPVTTIDGLTPDQRFFHAWARGWRRQHTDENLKLRVNTDVHAPAKFRVLGPFANLEAFHAAFGCESADPMVRVPKHRVAIW